MQNKRHFMNSYIQDEQIIEDKSNFRFLFRLLLGNIKFILNISGIALIIFTAYAFSIKKTWQGEFQIVVSNENKKLSNLSSIANQLPIANLVGATSLNQEELKTQLEILKSPSILISVFEFVKENNKYNVSERFQSWRKNNLDVDLINRTSVLNIKYKDSDKDIILPTLKKISKKYQEYTLLEKSKKDKKLLSFLKEQIKIYKIKSNDSLSLAQEYSLENNLPPFSDISLINKDNNNTEKQPSSSLEIRKNIAEDEIRKIDALIMQIEQLDDNSNIPIYFIKSGENKNNLQDKIKSLDAELITLRNNFKNNDPLIKLKSKERNALFNLLKKQNIENLKAKKIVAISEKNTYSRPREVLIKYSELVRKANYDLNTLLLLQKQEKISQLEDAQLPEPWKLITKPTLISYPIAPNRKRIIFIGLLTGLALGVSITYLKDRFKGKIYNEEVIEDLINIPIIVNLNTKNEDQSKELLQLFSKQLAVGKESANNIILKVPGLCDYSKTDVFFDSIKEYLIGFQIFEKKLGELEIRNNDNYYLLINFNEINEKRLKDFKEKITLIKINFKGIILINKFL